MATINRLLLICAIVCLTVGAATLAAAATHTVPGDFATITAALAAAGTGDTIQVGPGTYSAAANGETFPLTVAVDGLQLLGAGMGISILDAEYTAGVIVLDAAVGGRVSGFTITRGSAELGGGIRSDDGDWEIDNNLLLANRALVSGSGMVIYGAHQPWIHHNVVWECYDIDLDHEGDPHAVQTRDTATGVIEHNLVGRNDSNGIHFAPASEPDVRMNILFENGLDNGVIRRGRGICALSDGNRFVSYNLSHGNVIAAFLIRQQGNFDSAGANDLFPDDGIHHNLDGDPLLTNPDTGDFALLVGSPAIDAGDPALPGDPDGTVADIGPFYYPQGPAAVGDSPSAVRLLGASPNPFNPRTEIRFTLPEAAVVTVEVLDVRGRRVSTLLDGMASAGMNSVAWDGRDDHGASVASGVFLAAIRHGDVVRTAPMLLLR